jgi:hypothetical protein
MVVRVERVRGVEPDVESTIAIRGEDPSTL